MENGLCFYNRPCIETRGAYLQHKAHLPPELFAERSTIEGDPPLSFQRPAQQRRNASDHSSNRPEIVAMMPADDVGCKCGDTAVPDHVHRW